MFPFSSLNLWSFTWYLENQHVTDDFWYKHHRMITSLANFSEIYIVHLHLLNITFFKNVIETYYNDRNRKSFGFYKFKSAKRSLQASVLESKKTFLGIKKHDKNNPRVNNWIFIRSLIVSCRRLQMREHTLVFEMYKRQLKTGVRVAS